jgi:hypothetical protein
VAAKLRISFLSEVDSHVGVSHLFDGCTEEANDAMRRTIDYAMDSPFEIGAAGARLNVLGEVRQGQSLIDKALQINPRLPGWIRWGTSIGQLGQGDYHAAVETAKRFSMPKCFWNPMLNALAISATGEMDQKSLEQAIRLRPELGERPRELGGRIIKQPEVLDQFVDCVPAAAPFSGQSRA